MDSGYDGGDGAVFVDSCCHGDSGGVVVVDNCYDGGGGAVVYSGYNCVGGVVHLLWTVVMVVWCSCYGQWL